MARLIVHQLIDDLDGTVIEAGAGDTVTFALDGVAYEIDLTDTNAVALRAMLEPYVSAGRRISGRAGTQSSPRKRSAPSTHDLGAIRTWANANGYSVADRGRVPAAVIDAYYAAK